MQSKIKICKTDLSQTKKMWNKKSLKIRLTDFFFNFGSKHDLPKQINCENFIMGCSVGFWTMVNQRLVLTSLDGNWIAHTLCLSTRSCDTMYHVRESKSKLEVFYLTFIGLFFAIFFFPWLKHMFEQSRKLLLHIPRWFNAFQVMKLFLFLLKVAWIIFACATNAGVWQAIVAHATESWKNCS